MAYRQINLEVAPILAALKRNKTGAILMVLQVALMVAFISNLVSIVAERASLVARPTGMDERNLFAIGFRLTHGEESLPMLQTDLAGVRATPGVIDVVATNSYPLRGSGWQEGVSHHPGSTSRQEQSAQTGVYAMDEHGISTMGLKLVAGRNFVREDINQGNFGAAPLPGFAIITRSLKSQLFGQGEALGQLIYLTTDSSKPITVIGVVDRLQSAAAAGSIDEHESENTVILPIASVWQGGLFLVRVQPGAIAATMGQVQNTLIKANPDRIFGRLRPFTEVRGAAYEKDRSIAIAFGILLVVVMVITALAIVGLTSFWVVRRKTQIGIRRALGATRVAIVRYFLVENALLCLAGVMLGVIASESLNVWLWTYFGIDRMHASALLICAVAVVSLGQFAAMFPALRASRTSPTEALRST
jgi:putative ABC transport system permease protein